MPTKKKNYNRFNSYISKIFKNNYNGHTISSKSIDVVDDAVKSIFKKISSKARSYCLSSGKKTITSDEIKLALNNL